MKCKIYLVLFILGSISFMAKAQDVPTRDKIDSKYKWNLTDFYKTNDDFEKDFKAVAALSDKFVSHKGKITTSAKSLLSSIKDYYEIWERFSKLITYSSLLADIDVSNGENQILNDRTKKLASDIAANLAFYTTELVSMPYSTVEKYLKEEKELGDYKFALEQAFRMKPHTLSEESEGVLAKMQPIIDIPNKTYGILNNTELPLPIIKDSEGNDVQITHGRYAASLYSIDRNYRRDIYKGMYQGYGEVINTFGALFNGRVASRIALADIRKFSSPIEAAVYSDNIPVEVYDNLIKNIQKNVSTLHRWAEIKRKTLKLDKIHPYDTYVTLFPAKPKQYTFEEGKDIVREALKPLGEEYIKALDLAFNNRWIDVYETKSKRNGAYSTSGDGGGIHPWVLLNWGGTLNDVFTLAHEMGHNMHTYFTNKNQPFYYSDYSIFVAEVASTTNEALLLNYLINKATTKEEKCSLYEAFLVNAQATFFRQARFAEFEQMVHEKAQKGEYLSADELSKLFAERYQYYWGDAMETDKEEGFSWARIHHITEYNFYVYQYSTGFAAAQALSEQILKEGKPAIDRYLKFLCAGASDTPINVLKMAGVDMSKPDPINKTITKMNHYLDELEKLMK